MNPVNRKTNPSLSLEPTTPRSTPREGTSFREVLGGSAAVLVRGAESALYRLPGGPTLAAAVRASPNAPAAAAGTTLATSPVGSTAAEGPSAANPPNSLETALTTSQDMNLYYLRIQESMAAENRAYSASSNVLKARHDTVKNAIGNIR